MELYVLTQAGREVIDKLHKKGRGEEASMLEYIGRVDGATVEQLAWFMHLDENEVYDKLRSLSAKRWIWHKTTKLTLF